MRNLQRLWLVLYALLAVAVPLADARADHAPVTAHWEDASDASCPPQHDASACQLCQSLKAFGRVPAAAAAVPVSEQAGSSGPRGADAHTARAPSRGEPPSRAPPRA